MNRSTLLKEYLFLAVFTVFIMGALNPIYAVKTSKAPSDFPTQETTTKVPAIPPAVISKFEKNAKQAIVFSAVGVAMVIGVVAILSLGTMTGALPLLGVAGIFANIGFIKAMRLRQRTKSRKKPFRKARHLSKTAIILSCVLGITLIFGLLSLLLKTPTTF